MKESSIEQYCTKEVQKLGGICAKHVSPGRAGDPDRLIKLPGKPAAMLELKRPGEEPREDQWERIFEWRAVGMLADYACTKWQIDQFLRKVLDQ